MTTMTISNKVAAELLFSSDQCTFLNGIVNRHNCRYLSDDKTYVFREKDTQCTKKLNVEYFHAIIGPLSIN